VASGLEGAAASRHEKEGHAHFWEGLAATIVDARLFRPPLNCGRSQGLCPNVNAGLQLQHLLKFLELSEERSRETITKWGLRRVLRMFFAGLHARIPPTKQVPEFVV
jgi:hypothetical protein